MSFIKERDLVSITYEERAAWYDIEQCVLDDEHYLKYFVSREGTSVLEIPCASGRNISWLGKCGNQVVVSDISPRMLALCKQKVAQLNLDIQCVLGGLETIKLDKAVDTIIVPQDAFLLLAGERAMLNALITLRSNLNQLGRILIDVPLLAMCRSSATASTLYFDIDLPENTSFYEWKRALPNGCWLHRKRRQLLNGGRTVTILFSYDLYDRDNFFIDTYSSSIELMVVTVKSMLRLIKQSGLEVEEVHQDYDMTPLTEKACRAIFWLRN